MQCPYCGREVKEGEVFCECGRPVNVGGSGASTPVSSNPYLPEGVSLESLHKPAKQTNMITFIFVIGIVCVGIILFFVFKNKGGSSDNDRLDDKSKWQKITRSNYSMSIPSSLKDEKKRMLSVGDKSVELLDFFSGEEGAVLINREAWDADAKQIINDNGLDAVKQLIEADFSRRTKANGPPVHRADYIYIEFDEVTHKNYIGKSDKLYEVHAAFVAKDALYTVQAFCAAEDKELYRAALIMWLDTFEPS